MWGLVPVGCRCRCRCRCFDLSQTSAGAAATGRARTGGEALDKGRARARARATDKAQDDFAGANASNFSLISAGAVPKAGLGQKMKHRIKSKVKANDVVFSLSAQANTSYPPG